MILREISFKLRIQIMIVASVTIVSILLTVFYQYQEKNYARERAEISTQNVKKAFNSVINDLEHFYVYRSRDIASNPIVKEEMIGKKSLELYSSVLPVYSELKRENPYLKILQFHASDGHSIIRMHRKNEYGDDIASRRPMLRATHATQRIHSGFEGGIQGIAYRVVVPVFDNQTYIGAIEFGVSTDYIISKLKSFVSSDAVVMIHQSRLAAADTSVYTNGIGAYRFTQKEYTQKTLLDLYAENNSELNPKIVTVGDQDFEINPLFLYDDGRKKIGAILCIQNITGGYQNLSDTLIKSVFLTLIIIAFFLGFFEYAFGALMSKIRFQDEYIRTILNSQKNIIIVSDGKNILFANQAFFNYFDYPTLEAFKKDHQCICDFFEHSDTEIYLQPEMEGGTWTEYLVRYGMLEHKAKMTHGDVTSIFGVHAQMMQFEGQTRYVVVFTDITKLNELATIDALTRVPNRFQFDKVFEYSANISMRTQRPFSLILFDIDHFKQVNDQFGHLVGDDVLKKLSSFIRRNIRKTDVLARWGGEEFVILLPETNLENAEKLAEMIRSKIENHTFISVRQVTCSMGVVEYTAYESEDSLMKRADDYLYRAKKEGRNRVVSS